MWMASGLFVRSLRVLCAKRALLSVSDAVGVVREVTDLSGGGLLGCSGAAVELSNGKKFGDFSTQSTHAMTRKSATSQFGGSS